MTSHIHSPAELRAILEAEADDISSPQELLDRAHAATDARGPHRRTRRPRIFVAWGTSVLLIIAVAVTLVVWAPRPPRHSPPAATTPTSHPVTGLMKRITFDGVELTIPSSWPVVDGAHLRFTCSSTFEGQADRAFLGATNQGAPSCAAGIGAPPPADGVWMQPGGSTPPDGASTVLPSGQKVYLSTVAQTSSVYVWYHDVSIQIGIGFDSGVERAILDSIGYNSTGVNSPVLGGCPAPNKSAPTLPTPVRLTARLVLANGNGQMQPEPPAVQPKVSAATVWSSFAAGFGRDVNGVQWSIVFGSYSAQTPAHLNPDGSTTPQYRGVPTWLIEGTGIQTDQGACGITVLAPYNADTGQPMDVTTIG